MRYNLSGDRIFPPSWGSGHKLWTELFLNVFKMHHVPAVGKNSLTSLPKFQEHRRPHRHENSEDNRAVVIECMGCDVVITAWDQRPVGALTVTQGTHVEFTFVGFVANIFYGLKVACVNETVQENEEPKKSGRNKHDCVKSQPGEVQANFGTKIILDGVIRLKLEPTSEPRPVTPQALPIVRGGFPLRTFFGTRMERVRCSEVSFMNHFFNSNIILFFTKLNMTTDVLYHSTPVRSAEESVFVLMADINF